MQTLIAHIEEVGADAWVVRSPAVGIVDCVPQAGLLVNGHATVLHLEIMGRSVAVKLPRDGYYEIWARAMDTRGQMQPHVAPNWNPSGYGGNPMHRIAVLIA